MAFVVLHLDDQPEFVSWIPGTLFRHLKRKFGNTCEYEEADQTSDPVKATYKIDTELCDEKVEIVYELHSNRDKFVRVLKRTSLDNEVLTIFDLHIGDDMTAGVELVNKLMKDDTSGPRDNWVFLTGFPQELAGLLGVDGEQAERVIVAKPPNTTDFIARIVDAIETKLKGEQHDAAR